jgi:hypothetical protein
MYIARAVLFVNKRTFEVSAKIISTVCTVKEETCWSTVVTVCQGSSFAEAEERLIKELIDLSEHEWLLPLLGLEKAPRAKAMDRIRGVMADYVDFKVLDKGDGVQDMLERIVKAYEGK